MNLLIQQEILAAEYRRAMINGRRTKARGVLLVRDALRLLPLLRGERGEVHHAAPLGTEDVQHPAHVRVHQPKDHGLGLAERGAERVRMLLAPDRNLTDAALPRAGRGFFLWA